MERTEKEAEMVTTDTNNVPTVSCWLCDEPVEVRFSKKDKPYIVCPCGIQVFVRYKRAEELLAQKVRMENGNG